MPRLPAGNDYSISNRIQVFSSFSFGDICRPDIGVGGGQGKRARNAKNIRIAL